MHKNLNKKIAVKITRAVKMKQRSLRRGESESEGKADLGDIAKMLRACSQGM